MAGTPKARIEVMRRPLPAGDPLAGRFDLVRARPSDAHGDAYALVAPVDLAAEGLVERSPDRAPGDLAVIGALRSREGDAVECALAALGRDVSLADFVAWDIERRGLVPESLDALDLDGREAVDALGRAPATEGNGRSGGAGPRIERHIYFRRGDAVARISASAAAARWGARAQDLAIAVASLRFDDPRRVAFLEPYVWSASAGAIPLGFRRPASWRCEERADAPWGREVLDLRRIADGAVTDALRVIAVDRDTSQQMPLAALAAEALAGMKELGLEPGPLRRRSTPAAPDAIFKPGALALVHDGRAFGGKVEARVHCLETAGALYALAAIVPARDPDRLAWMCGKRVLDVALQTLLRPEEEILTPEAARRAAGAAGGEAPDPVSPLSRDERGSLLPVSLEEE